MTSQAKMRAGAAALDFVDPGMTLGLGTGSTAEAFIRALGENVAGGFDIRGIATSQASEDLARSLGIDIVVPDETTKIDLAIDGADEIDTAGHLIKGGGGAHLREKIIERAADKFLVIADDSKAVSQLGAFPLPIELDPFCWSLTVRLIRETLVELGYTKTPLALRAGDGREGFFLSDGGNYILDAQLGRIADPARLDQQLTMIPGVVCTGLFVGMADIILLATENDVEVRHVR